jgi:hypothetical protein
VRKVDGRKRPEEVFVPPPGSIVRSTAGRDRGLDFVVLAVENDRVWIADGRHHPVARPKRKNPKHLVLRRPPPDGWPEWVAAGPTDDELRRRLATILGEGGADERGQG